ncbi:ORF V: Enzymatic polyprotein [Labeo rohita]|uniref:ORF V: Enzymatic polyprotein n=1 Tax=Labeo rohita TaxID=84645 RepID=A0ABQ8MSC0_LABRO|nr:ORF V: Enzymatic polyprotein [Labeo rohita]
MSSSAEKKKEKSKHLDKLCFRAGIHTLYAWFVWERSTRRRLLRGPTARTVSVSRCARSAPGRLSSRREPSPAFLAGPVPLPPRRSGYCTHGVSSWICWRVWRRVSPYLLPHPADPPPVPRVRKPALRFLPPGGRARRSVYHPPSFESFSHEAEIQDAYSQASSVTDQVRGLVCDDRSKRRLFPRLHPSSTQEVPEVCFQGQSIPISGSSVRPSTSPRTFTKCVDAALAPLRFRGIRILNYIDDWLILAQSEQVAAQHRCCARSHERVGAETERQEKCAVSITKDHLSRRGVGFDHNAGTFVSRSDRVDPCCSQESQRRPVTHCKAVPATAGSDGSCIQRHTFWPAVHETHTVVAKDQGVLPEGKPAPHDQSHAGPVLGAPCRCVTLTTDASLTGWGAVMSGHTARGLWSGHQLTWHINCLEMMAVFQALKHFLPDLRDHHVLVRTDNTAVVSYINHQGGLRSRPLYKLAHQILVWSQGKLLSLRAVYLPGYLNVGADILSRQGPRSGEWMLHPEVVKQIWRVFGQAQVDLFATRENLQYPLWYSLVQGCSILVLEIYLPGDSSSLPGAGCHGTDLAEASSVRFSPDRSAPGSSRESAPGRGVPPSSSPVLAGPSMVRRPDFCPRRLSMGDSRQEGSPLTGGGHHLPPPSGAVETLGVASEGAHLLASGLSTEVVETILQSRAPSTRKLYALKCLFAGLTHSTLKVYVAAIAAYHAPLGGLLVGKDPLVTRFLRGALRLRPPVRSRVPSWDLSVVLEALCRPPFEPIEEISDRHLTIKTVLLIAITSLKRVGDLQALSVAPSFLDFAPGLAKAFLHPRPGYIPKVPSSAPRPVVLQAFCPPPFREPDQQRGLPATKQTLSRWIVDAISCAYESSGLPPPLGVKAHSTRSVSASKAFLEGVSMQDICNAAGWSTPLTFLSLGRDLDSGSVGILFPKRFDAARVPERERLRLPSWLVTSPACDVSLFHWTDYTCDSEHGHAEGVPKAFRRGASFPQGTRVTYVT